MGDSAPVGSKWNWVVLNMNHVPWSHTHTERVWMMLWKNHTLFFRIWWGIMWCKYVSTVFSVHCFYEFFGCVFFCFVFCFFGGGDKKLKKLHLTGSTVELPSELKCQGIYSIAIQRNASWEISVLPIYTHISISSAYCSFCL